MEQVRRLWRGERVDFDGFEVRTLPVPCQPELPVWLTSAGSPDTAELAGRSRAGLLTHLLGQTFEELGELIDRYRQGCGDHAGHVTLMLHTFLREDADEAARLATPPLREYLRSATTLQAASLSRMGVPVPVERLSEDDWDVLVAHAAKRYLDGGSLIGSPTSCEPVLERAAEAGVDEIACLIDFVTDTELVLESLPILDELRRKAG
jgi:natural product biosynthesis luciferase-like monooxygenase protein